MTSSSIHSTPRPAAVHAIFNPEDAAALLDAILARLRAARGVQLIGHVRPDGDCIGSMLAMHGLLETWGIPHALAAESFSVNSYEMLDGIELLQPSPDPNLNPDLIVYLDCASRERGITDWQPTAPIINVDHHVSNTMYGELNWIEPRCAATGEMVYYLIRRSGAPLTPPMAEVLLIALTTDTGSFRFTNTGPAQHLVAAELLKAGASVERVSHIAFDSRSPQSVCLSGYVLHTLRLECGGKLAWSEITQSTYDQFGGEDNLPENLADLMRAMRGVELGILFHELSDGSLRVNFRSKGRIDVCKLAAEFGGGGHPCAAGLTLRGEGDYPTQRDRLLDRIREVLAAYCA